MELRHLRYFIVVAEERNFTRAAARLNMQQPPLSQQIRSLEQELGFALFLRHPKGVDLTIGGAVFLSEAKAILGNVESATLRATRASKGIEGNISVGLTSSAATHPLIPQILRAHRATRPHVDVKFTEGNAAELTAAIAMQKLDLCFLRMPVTRPEGLAFHRLADEEMLLVLPVGHALLKAHEGTGIPTVYLASLRQEQFILVRKPGGSGMYSSLIEACRRIGYTPGIVAEVDRMLSSICLVAAGVGITAVPASMRGFHSDQVVFCRIGERDTSLSAPLTLVSLQEPASQAVRHFVLEAGRIANFQSE